VAAAQALESMTWFESLCVVKAAQGIGTGFAFLRAEWIVTAKHVVASQSAAPIELRFWDDRARPARLLFAHTRVDLAVLELIGPPAGHAPLVPDDRPLPPDRLICAGYKPSVSDPASGRYATFVSDVDRYQRSRRHRDGHEEALFIFPAPHGEAGHSGGPLLTPEGTVVGVVVDGITLGGEHLIRATSIAPVRDRLEGGNRA
jgi:S1-C subfamily serine protease